MHGKQMVDFGNLRKPDQKGRPADPREIFKRRPSGEGAANDLWQGQAEALEIWFKQNKGETLVSLNTGAGKTIIGLLIAQSYMNQSIRNVVYVCSTIDLVRQTDREAKKLGLQVTCRYGSKFDNDLFSQGKSFCITTYQAVINAKTVFRGVLKPGAVIFDDAHVATRTIREAFTLRINKKDKPTLFAEVVNIVRPAFSEVGQALEFQSALREDRSGAALFVPPCGFHDSSDKVASAIDSQISDKEPSLYFPWLFLRDHLRFCACFIRNDVIELTPPFLPTLTLQAFARDVKRVYLSATITTRADFTRVFGHEPETSIAPNVDAGNGERLFLFASKFEKGRVAPEIVKRIAAETKVLIAVPSRIRGENWTSFAAMPERDDFSDQLDRFRTSPAGAFVLAGRFDGIDLPGSQCRVMVVDGLPASGSLIEQYLFETIQMDHFFSNTLSVRLTQLLGRIIRGRQDFGFFIVADRAVENWLKNERNRSLLPELLRRQLFLSEAIEAQIPGAIDSDSALDTMNKVLKRDSGWVDFYRDNINDLDVPEARLRENANEDEVLSEVGKREVWFMTKLWDNDITGAREELESRISEVAIYDPLLAGWYAVWVGITYYSQGLTDAAIDMFEDARRRIGRGLPLPRRKLVVGSATQPAKSMLEDALREIANGEIGKINDRVAKLKASTSDAFSKLASHKKCEEAVRVIGSALGFNSSRPCTDYGLGPDNLWIDVRTNKAIIFELKTDKSDQSLLKKEEVGQGHNHIEWFKKAFPELELVGLIFLTDVRKVSEKSSPSPSMRFGSQASLRKLFDEFVAVVERIRPLTPVERVVEAGKLGDLAEWSCEGIFKRIGDRRMTE